MAQITVQQALELALRHHQAGRLPEAEQLYRQILAQQPANAQALHYLGVMAHQIGRTDIAEDLMRRAIAQDPGYAEAHSNLGNLLRETGQLDDAIAACRKAIALQPNFAQAHNNLGNALMNNGQLDESIAAYRQALILNPGFAEAHFNLGNAHNDKGHLIEAVASYRRAIALKPGYAAAYNNLSVALKDAGQLDDAIAAARQAIALWPNFAEAHGNLGIALKHKGQLDDAIAAYRQAIAHNPGYAEAHSNLGVALKDAGQLDEAIAASRWAAGLEPGNPKPDSDLVFALFYHPDYNAQTIAGELRRWNTQHAQPLPRISVHSNDPSPGRPLRIGYVSPDFRDHVVGRNLLPLFQHHDRREFEITCYAQVSRPDAMSAQFQQLAHRWRDITGVSDDQVADQIRQDSIDVLVDLALHSGKNRLLIFARKPAPVQATFAGYPGSTGLTAIDYRLSDPYLDPIGIDESVYSERIIRLPDSFWCYDPLDCRDISFNSLPALERGFITFGCLNNFCKINDRVLSLWAQVMRQIENSRLLLMAPPGNHRLRTLERFRQEGIDPGRIEFVTNQPRQKYLETYHRMDLGLDTFPYNGHTTSLDSLWMGVPVITRVGQTSVARAGWSQLSNLRMTELAGQSPEQFVQIAAELAGDLSRLAELRRTLRRRMERSPLMDGPRFARNIEAAYRRMWQTWCEPASGRS